MRRLAGLGVLLLLVFAAASGASVRPPTGTRFAGKTSQGRTIHLKVTTGGGLQMDFVEIATCNRGPKKSNHALFKRDKPHVRRNGTFDYHKTYRNLAPIPGFAEPFDDIQHIKGSFPDGRHVRGRFDETVRGRRTGLTCVVHLTFSAIRSG